MAAHGAASFLKETFLNRADSFIVHICNKCGYICPCNPKRNIYQCKYCQNFTKFNAVNIPYAFKLFTQEIKSMSISTKFIT